MGVVRPSNIANKLKMGNAMAKSSTMKASTIQQPRSSSMWGSELRTSKGDQPEILEAGTRDKPRVGVRDEKLV